MNRRKIKPRFLAIGIFAVLCIAVVVSCIHVKTDPLFDMDDATHMTITINGYDESGEFGKQEKILIDSGTPEYNEILLSLQDTKYYRTVGSYLWNALLGGEELTIHGNQGKLLNLVFWNDSEIIKSAMLTSEKEVLCEGTLYFVQNDDLVDGIWTFLDK